MKNKNNFSRLVPQLKAKSALLMLSLLAVVSCSRTTDSTKTQKEINSNLEEGEIPSGSQNRAVVLHSATPEKKGYGTVHKEFPAQGKIAAVYANPVKEKGNSVPVLAKAKALTLEEQLVEAKNSGRLALNDKNLKAGVPWQYNRRLLSLRFMLRPKAYNKFNEEKALTMVKEEEDVATVEKGRAEKALNIAQSTDISEDQEREIKTVKAAYQKARKSVRRMKAAAQMAKGTNSEQTVLIKLGNSWEVLQSIEKISRAAGHIKRDQQRKKLETKREEEEERKEKYRTEVEKINQDIRGYAQKALADRKLSSKNLMGQTGYTREQLMIKAKAAGEAAEEHESIVSTQLSLSQEANKSLDELKAISDTARQEVELAWKEAKLAYKAYQKAVWEEKAEIFEQLGIAYRAAMNASIQAEKVMDSLVAKAREELDKAYEKIDSGKTAAIAALLKDGYMPSESATNKLSNSMTSSSRKKNTGRSSANEKNRQILDELEHHTQAMIARVAANATVMNTDAQTLEAIIAPLRTTNANNNVLATWRDATLRRNAVTLYDKAKKEKKQGTKEALKVRRAMAAVLRAEKEIIRKRALAQQGQWNREEIPTEEILKGWTRAVGLADKAKEAGDGMIAEFEKLTVAFKAIEAIKQATDASKKVVDDKNHGTNDRGADADPTHSYRLKGKSLKYKRSEEENKVGAANAAIGDWKSRQPLADGGDNTEAPSRATRMWNTIMNLLPGGGGAQAAPAVQGAQAAPAVQGAQAAPADGDANQEN